MKDFVMTLFAISIAHILFAQNNRIEAENFSELSKCQPKEVKMNGKVTGVISQFSRGAWVRYEDVDCKKGVSEIVFRGGSGSTANPTIEIRLGSPNGKLIATQSIGNEGWTKARSYGIQTKKLIGKQNLVFVSVNGEVMFDWFELIL
ncbi:carbohydrate-binding protein [Parapedobacter sp. SGR-10]|uniref:carbohydrate-binding protein n=1 Tax=Parapedobacter sp. SGR-10 TaxID=2710879 RepID=UPI0013D2ED60|nr:carbohydrate-binding protein [Parapedobacter sp. SGR-10]NGF55475.1 carbohydrate-binding protein [Parapedobacter sp. SGR-10]